MKRKFYVYPEDKKVYTKYDPYTFIEVCKNLDELKDHHHQAMYNIFWYQKAFAFLEKQQWFLKNRESLIDYIEKEKAKQKDHE